MNVRRSANGRPLRIAVVGDTLLDRDLEGEVRRLAPDAPVPIVDHDHTTVRPGGAGLAAALAAGDGAEVRLVTALADDDAGRELADTLAERRVAVTDVGLAGETPEKIRVRVQGRALLRVDRGCEPGRVGAGTAEARAAIGWADAVLVADYGRGVAAEEALRSAIGGAIAAGVPVVWDPHPRGARPVPGALLVTPNDREARGFAAEVDGDGPSGVIARGEALRERWEATWVCVTRGRHGAIAVGATGPPLVVPVDPVQVGDPCGAGDRFASRAAEVLAAGGDVPGALRSAAASASAFVAAGGAGGADGDAGLPRPLRCTTGAAQDVVARVRARGGTVVATGGCFDLLHAGHVGTLQAARALGDCLVVCLNSDASVHRLKGPRRPLVGERDRAAVLSALGCVDAVEIFEEDTPAEVLRRLRPDLWVKGGDYSACELPEAGVLAGWGGRAIVLPFLDGRSTTRLIQEAALHAV